VRKLAGVALRQGKGAGWAARLFEDCDYTELPPTVVQFLRDVFAALPKPPEIADPAGDEPQVPVPGGANLADV
jgi:putative ATP-dependent endonuclease of OLD family